MGLVSESVLKAAIRLAVGRDAPQCRLFNNPVGLGWSGRIVLHEGGVVTLADARRIAFGLMPGSSDLIGWTTVAVTPEMVGRRLAVFTSPEVKTQSGRARPGQPEWIRNVVAAGGIAGIVRSPDDALRLVSCVEIHSETGDGR